MQEERQLSAKITDGIYVGNSLPRDEISAIVNLDNLEFDDVDPALMFNFALPSQELMPNEIPKLESIAKSIKDLRDNNRDVMIICADGRNKCMLVAGYYLISRGGLNADNVIKFLETIYFTPEQRKEEDADNAARDSVIALDIIPVFTEESLRRQEERRKIKCLTMRSFRSVLKAHK